MISYRYTLTRRWDPLLASGPTIGWILLNPSTAESENPHNDPSLDDPTMRKVRGFTQRLGGSAFVLCNTSPFRATDPKELIAAHRRGVDVWKRAENDDAIADMGEQCSRIVVAWGATVDRLPEWRAAADQVLLTALAASCGDVCRLGPLTNGGHPRHPLFLPYSTALELHAPTTGT